MNVAIGIIGDSDANREVPKLPEVLRVLWLVAKNSVGRGRNLHVSSVFIIFQDN
jgi:hypothetical protein